MQQLFSLVSQIAADDARRVGAQTPSRAGNTSPSTMVSPHLPLSFERLGGTARNDVYDSQAAVVEAADAFGSLFKEPKTPEAQGFADWWVSDDARRAYETAMAGYEHAARRPDSAVQAAESALSISPLCPDAYCLLALFKVRARAPSQRDCFNSSPPSSACLPA